MTISMLFLILALACFLAEAIRGRSLVAGGLACWVLSLLIKW